MCADQEIEHGAEFIFFQTMLQRRKGTLGAKGGSTKPPQAPPPSASVQVEWTELEAKVDAHVTAMIKEVMARNELLEKKVDSTDAFFKTLETKLKALETKVERVSFRENVLQVTFESRMDDVGNRIEGLEAIGLEKLVLRVDDIDNRLGDIHDTATFALVSLVLVNHLVDAGFFIPSFVFPLSLCFSLISPTLQTNFDQIVNANKSTAEEAKATAEDANSTAEQLTLNLENRIKRFETEVEQKHAAHEESMSKLIAAKTAEDANSTAEQLTLNLENRIKLFETEIEQKHAAHEESMSKLIAAKMANTKKEFKKIRDFISNSAKPSFEHLEEMILQLGTRVTAVEKDLMVFKGSSA